MTAPTAGSVAADGSCHGPGEGQQAYAASLASIEAAAERIAMHATKTPVLHTTAPEPSRAMWGKDSSRA